MGGQPSAPDPPRSAFSPDGLWWWDGAEWRPAVSQDRLWRWDGRSWVPAQAAPRAGGGTGACVITVLAFGGVLFLVTLITVVILLTMGNQIANVFSNVVAALGA
jgi:hypothetical protein